MTVGDHIEIRRISVLGRHGALKGEQEVAQPFEVDLDLYLDLEPARQSDDLASTVDYGLVTMSVVAVVSETRFALLEALAGAIADEVLQDSRIQRVEVTLRKMRPPIPAELASVGVRLARSRRSA